jgi:hypothetical protein
MMVHGRAGEQRRDRDAVGAGARPLGSSLAQSLLLARSAGSGASYFAQSLNKQSNT